MNHVVTKMDWVGYVMKIAFAYVLSFGQVLVLVSVFYSNTTAGSYIALSLWNMFCTPCAMCCENDVYIGILACRCTPVHYVRFLWYQRYFKYYSNFLDIAQATLAGVFFNRSMIGIGSIVLACGKLLWRFFRHNSDTLQVVNEAKHVYVKLPTYINDEFETGATGEIASEERR